METLPDYIGEIYEALITGLEIPKKPPTKEQIPSEYDIWFMGTVVGDLPDWFIRVGAGRFEVKTDPMKLRNWRQARDDLVALTKLLDKRKTPRPTVTKKIENLATLTGFDVRENNLPDKLFLNDEEVGVIVRHSSDFFHGQFLFYLREQVGPSLWAAQFVLPCAQGNEAICRLVKRMLGRKPTKGSREWYLEKAYREIVKGDLEPREFLKVYYNIANPALHYKKGEIKKEIKERKKKRI